MSTEKRPHLQIEVGNWAQHTFPHATDETILTHLRREVDELAAAIGMEGVGQEWISHNIGKQSADVLLLLFHLCQRHHIPLLTYAANKHDINVRREWAAPDAEGVSEHVRP